MNKSLSIIYGVLILLLIGFSAYIYHENQVLKCRINSLNKNSIDFDSAKTFKEDYYITQQNRDTTFLLVVFPLIVGLTSYFTYQNLRKSFESRILEVQAENEKNKREYDEKHRKIENLENDFNFETALLQGALSKDYFDKGLAEESLVISIRAATGFALCTENYNYYNNNSAKENLILELDFLEKITEHKVIDIKWSFFAFKDSCRKIDKVLEKGDLIRFNKIKSKINIVE